MPSPVEYRCTDCGKPMPYPGGTCDDCLIANQPKDEPPPEKKKS